VNPLKVEAKLEKQEEREKRYRGTSLRALLEAKNQFCQNCQQPEALCRCIKRKQ